MASLAICCSRFRSRSDGTPGQRADPFCVPRQAPWPPANFIVGGQTGRQLSVASKRRQSGKVETHFDLSEQPLLMGRECSEAGEVVIAVVRYERNQEQQGTGQKRRPTLAIQQPGLRRQSWLR